MPSHRIPVLHRVHSVNRKRRATADIALRFFMPMAYSAVPTTTTNNSTINHVNFMDDPNQSEALPGDITQLLQQFRHGDAAALWQVMPMVYDELRSIARQCVKAEQASWQPTALAHELIVGFFEGHPPDWQNREHFFATASLKMRHLLVDAARRKRAFKHGGGLQQVEWDEVTTPDRAARLEEILSVNEALDALAADYPRVVKMVELRFFLGLSEAEAASILSLSTRQARRDYAFAKSWLATRL
jgi:RNA polymerase sigma factor (TIGR02999 family)